jgi:hypothetical protein
MFPFYIVTEKKYTFVYKKAKLKENGWKKMAKSVYTYKAKAVPQHAIKALGWTGGTAPTDY